jgi:phospholipid transport system substrate-binding protein
MSRFLNRRQIVTSASTIALATAVFGMSVFTAPDAFAANAAESFVQTNIDKGYAILNSTVPDQQRRGQFRDFLLNLTDLRRIAVFTLGQYARGASPADENAFVDAFRNYAVAVYDSRLSKYKGQSMKVTSSTERAPDDVIVNCQVTSPQGGQPINAAFRVRTSDTGKLIVTDLQVEGVWLAISERDEFTAYLEQNGGSIRKLTDHLQELTAKVRTGGG